VYELTAAGASARSKVCSRCQARKPETSFWPSNHTPDGRAQTCKQCLAEIAKATGRRRRLGLAASAGRAP
jgi:ribosomal protein L40E